MHVYQRFPALGNQDGNTLVHLAASYGHSDILLTLIDRSADFNRENLSGDKPVHLAAKNGKIFSTLLTLFDRGVDITELNPNLQNALYLVLTISPNLALNFLDEVGVDIETPDSEGNTVLLLSVLNGDIQNLKQLANLGANINAVNKARESALHLAIRRGSSDIVRWLFDHHSDPTQNDSIGNSLLHSAVIYEQPTILKQLIEEMHIGVDHTNNSGNSALHYTAFNRNNACLLRLLWSGAQIGAVNESGETALHWAARESNYSLLLTLIDKGASINYIDKKGRTPLDLAKASTKENRQKCIDKLIEHGAIEGEPHHSATNFQQTPSTQMAQSVQLEPETEASLLSSLSESHALPTDLTTEPNTQPQPGIVQDVTISVYMPELSPAEAIIVAPDEQPTTLEHLSTPMDQINEVESNDDIGSINYTPKTQTEEQAEETALEEKAFQ